VKRVVIFGDSGVYGHDLPQHLTWARRIQERLPAHYWVSGQNGETTQLALDRFRLNAIVPNPDVLILQYGHNDANCWKSDGGNNRVHVDAYQANLRHMILWARNASGADVIVIVPYRPPRQEVMLNGKTLGDTIADGYEQACASLQSVATIIWPQDKLVKHDPDKVFYPEPDARHLTRPGHTVMLDAVARALKKFL